MIAAVRLGWRWAIRAGDQRRRNVMSVVGLAVACLIVIAALAMTGPVANASSCDAGDLACQGRVQLLAFCAFGVPGIVLMCVLSRLSALTRGRQTEQLRMLGVGARDLRVATSVEAGVLGAVASAVAIVVVCLVAAVMVSVVLQGVWSDYASGPVVSKTIAAETVGPNQARVVTGAVLDNSRLPPFAGRVAEVRFGIGHAGGSNFAVLVATCTEADQLLGADVPCDPSQPTVLTGVTLPSELKLELASGGTGTAVVGGAVSADGRGQRMGDLGQVDVIVPPALATLYPIRHVYIVDLPPGIAFVDRLREELAGSLPHEEMYVDSDNGGAWQYAEAMRLRMGFLGAGACVFLAALVGLLLACADRVYERRDLAGRLRVLGMPGGLIRAAVLGEQVLPLLILIPAAAAVGGAATWAMLAGESSAMEPPLLIAVRTGGITLAVAVLLVTAIVLTVLRTPSAPPQAECE